MLCNGSYSRTRVTSGTKWAQVPPRLVLQHSNEIGREVGPGDDTLQVRKINNALGGRRCAGQNHRQSKAGGAHGGGGVRLQQQSGGQMDPLEFRLDRGLPSKTCPGGDGQRSEMGQRSQ